MQDSTESPLLTFALSNSAELERRARALRARAGKVRSKFCTTDLLQDVCEAVFKRGAIKVQNPMGYLVQTLKRAYLSQLKLFNQEKRNIALECTYEALDQKSPISGPGSSRADYMPDSGLLAAETRARLLSVISELPELQAEVYCLRHFEERTIQEIAVQTQRTPAAVASALQRARRRIVECLK